MDYNTGYSSVNLWQRLPSTMRSIGKGFVEFKKGLKGVKDEVDEVEGDIKNIEDKDVDVK